MSATLMNIDSYECRLSLQQAPDVNITSPQRRCNDVLFTSSACRDIYLFLLYVVWEHRGKHNRLVNVLYGFRGSAVCPPSQKIDIFGIVCNILIINLEL